VLETFKSLEMRLPGTDERRRLELVAIRKRLAKERILHPRNRSPRGY